MTPTKSLTFACLPLPDSGRDCAAADMCTAVHCTSEPFDESRDCIIADTGRVCLAPPLACFTYAAPCAKPVPTLDPLAYVGLAIAAVAVGLAAIYRRAKRAPATRTKG